MTIEELEKKALELYPMPDKACSFVKKKIYWLRKRWIASQNVSGISFLENNV